VRVLLRLLFIVLATVSSFCKELLPVRTVTFPFPSSEIVFDSERSCAYALDDSNARVVKIDLTSGSTVGEVSLAGRRLIHAATPPNNRYLYVSEQDANPGVLDGYITEIDLNSFSKSNDFVVENRPNFLIATDARYVICSTDSESRELTHIRTYFAGTGEMISFVSDGAADIGNRIVMHPSGHTLYLFPGSGSFCFQAVAFDPVAGTLSVPPNNSICNGMATSAFGASFLDDGALMILDGGVILNVNASDPVQLSLANTLGSRADITAIDDANRTFFGADFQTGYLYQFNLDTLESESVYIPEGPYFRSLALIGTNLCTAEVLNGQSTLRVFPNPAAGRATNQAPTAAFSFSTNLFNDLPIYFDASSSHDDLTPPGRLEFRWDWETDGVYDTEWTTNATAIAQLPLAKTYIVTLAVRDDFGAISTITREVTITSNAPPTITLLQPNADSALFAPGSILIAAQPNDPEGQILRVDFFRDDILIGSRTSPPFSLPVYETQPGPHTYAVQAIDIAGAQSGKVSVTPTVFGAGAIPGDNIEAAIDLASVTQYATNFSNAGATIQKNEPLHAGKQGGHSLWFKWTAPRDGSLIVSTRGSSFDTLLAAYTGPISTSAPFSQLQTLTSNDDDLSNPPTSRLKLPATQGSVFWLAVDGYANSFGNVSLSLDFSANFAPAPNDDFASLIQIIGLTNEYSFNTSTATKEPGEPEHAGNRGGRSLWWSFAYPASGVVTLSTLGSDFDTLLAVYSQGSGPIIVSNLVPLWSNDDESSGGRSSFLQFTNEPNRVYYIAVDGYEGAAGLARLKTTWSAPFDLPPANDNFASAFILPAGAATIQIDTAAATLEANEPERLGIKGGRSIWFRWTAPASGKAKVSTKGSNFDTVLAVYTGTNIDSLAQIAGNDDDPASPPTSYLEFDAIVGVQYQIAVDGYGGAGGLAVLSIQPEPAPPRLSNLKLGALGLVSVEASSAIPLALRIELSSNLKDWNAVSTNQIVPPSATIILQSPTTADSFFVRAKPIQ
jgi:hypothetical protein